MAVIGTPVPLYAVKFKKGYGGDGSFEFIFP